MESSLAEKDLCVVVDHMLNMRLSVLLQGRTTTLWAVLVNAAEGQQVERVTVHLYSAPVRLARLLGGWTT